jgi:hypothetical protein
MGKHLRADGRVRGNSSTASDGSFRPALTDIPGACAYLGNIGRSKFYDDILSKLDIVKFGTRTFITLDSLDRLIAANCQLAVEAGEGSNEPSGRHSSPEQECRLGGGGAVSRGTDAHRGRGNDVLPARGRTGRPAQGLGSTVTEPEVDPQRGARKTRTP